MTPCSVRWRPSGGRGEFEFVPADSLRDRDISVDFEAFGVRIPAEVRGVHVQGKPRLRKFDSHNRRKLHLPQLVMGVVGLPEPARSIRSQSVTFPLENKAFVMKEMDFDIVEDDGLAVVLAPLRVSIVHSEFRVELVDRLRAIAEDLHAIVRIRAYNAKLADAIASHGAEVKKSINSSAIRSSANRMLDAKAELFGHTNAGSAIKLIDAMQKTPVEAEEITGKEGRLLTRMHSYKERNRRFAQRVREHYKSELGGQLVCEACGCIGAEVYGMIGEGCMEVHHKVPIEQLQPDSVSVVGDMAVLCASCHRVVHAKSPCLTIGEVRTLLGDQEVEIP